MHGNNAVAYIICSTNARTTECWLANANPHNTLEPPTDSGYLCSDPISTYYIFTTYDSYNINDTKVAG